MVAEKLYDLLPQEWPKVIGDLPSTEDTIVGIMEYDGVKSTEYFGSQGCSIFNPIVKIVIRNTSYTEGQAWADEVSNLLHRYRNEDIGIYSCLMVSSPIYLGRNTQRLHEFQVTFNISIKKE